MVESDMIPEVMIKRYCIRSRPAGPTSGIESLEITKFPLNNRQVPKRKIHLEQLRLLAVRGKRPGQKGRETFFYKRVLEEN